MDFFSLRSSDLTDCSFSRRFIDNFTNHLYSPSPSPSRLDRLQCALVSVPSSTARSRGKCFKSYTYYVHLPEPSQFGSAVRPYTYLQCIVHQTVYQYRVK